MTFRLLIFLTAANVFAAPFDLVLSNGLIVDGSGRKAYRGGVGIQEGRIVAVGDVAGESRKVVDVNGAVIAPGFIDVHTHAENIEHHPAAKAFLAMGVTTLVLGNCGSSQLNLAEFFGRLGQKGFSPNVASLIGHGTVRRQVMGGSFLRPPTAKEMSAMSALVAQAMKDGSLGMSTGLIYLPGTYAKTEELVALAKVVSMHGGIYVSHMRSEGKEIFKAVDEVGLIGREAGLPVHISHLKLGGKPMWGKHKELLNRLNGMRAAGLLLTHDQYAYTASSTGIQQLIPSEARRAGRGEFSKLLNHPGKKSALVEQMKERIHNKGRDSYDYAVIADFRHEPGLNGLNIVQAAQRKYGKNSLEQQIELIFWIEKNGGGSGVFHGMHEDDARAFMRNPHTMFASDSSVRVFKNGVPHPRGYGNAARILARYVREQNVLTLEDAVRRMTSLPAQTFKLANRGILKKGSWADVVVFDPREVQDHSTFSKPHQYSTGFQLVLVNGQIVVEKDRHNGAGPGQIIRRER